MYRLNIDNIVNGINIRENLIELKKIIKNERDKRQLAYYLDGDYSIFIKLLNNSDAKIRRNAALILGDMEDDELVADIFNSYLKEKTLFIRSDYLKAIMKNDYSEFMDELKKSLDNVLETRKKDKENTKHYDDEVRLLRQLLYNSNTCEHEFTGGNKKTEIYLTSYPGCTDILLDTIKEINKRFAIIGTGALVYETSVNELKDLRVFKDFYFPIINQKPYVSIEDVKENIIKSDLVGLLRDVFTGSSPFTYRMQIKTSDNGNYDEQVKEITAAIDDALPNDLVNATGDYQIELRIIIKNSGTFSVYLRPCIIKDLRFKYRVNSTSEAMKPVLAACICEYLSKYFKEDGVVFDPFCGSGILMIERLLKTKALKSLGVDILELAVDSAKMNFDEAGLNVGTICKNFFNLDDLGGFKADEVITDLPRVSSKRNEAYIKKLYRNFFVKIKDYLKERGCLYLFTNLREGILEALEDTDSYEIIEERVFRKKDNSTLFVIKLK